MHVVFDNIVICHQIKFDLKDWHFLRRGDPKFIKILRRKIDDKKRIIILKRTPTTTDTPYPFNRLKSKSFFKMFFKRPSCLKLWSSKLLHFGHQNYYIWSLLHFGHQHFMTSQFFFPKIYDTQCIFGIPFRRKCQPTNK